MRLGKTALLLLLLLAMSVVGTAEQLLPGVAVFSPGLIRLSEKMREQPPVHMEAELSVSDAYYVRDTSVLSAMLKGTTFVYDGMHGENGPIDRLSILRGEETLFDALLHADGVTIQGEEIAIPEMPIDPKMQALLEFVEQTAILERAPLAEVEAVLLSLEAGEPLFGGFSIVQPFVSVQTMSDDGTRLTRINISGSIAREGEAPWVIKGYLKQPAGRAPKDTFDLTATLDEENYLEISYSSLRQSEIIKRNRSGKNNVDTHIKIAGKIGGYRVNEYLSSYLRNTWSADGDNLKEKIIVSMILEHSDNTPGREMQRMNEAKVKMRHEMNLTTQDAGTDVFCLSDVIDLSAVMDENTVLSVQADAEFVIGDETRQIDWPAAKESGRNIEDVMEEAKQEIARGIYPQLTDTMQEKILDGLE